MFMTESVAAACNSSGSHHADIVPVWLFSRTQQTCVTLMHMHIHS